jgi:hypothetical protein
MNTLQIYPVPADEAIYLSGVSDGSYYTIYNVAGLKIASGVISEKTINVSQLEQGIYFVVVDNLRGKFIKQ